MTDPIDAFRHALEAAGLSPESIIADGVLHRFPTSERGGDDSGWYVLHIDGIPAGAFGCWRQGINETWCGQSELSADERRQNADRIERIKRERIEQRKQQHIAAASRAASLWQNASDVTTHPYLEAKGVGAHGIKCRGNALLIPMRQGSELLSVQFINGDGSKRFLPGGQVRGCYHAIGKPNGVLYIAEGYATAASVHEATGHATACAFNAGNLKPVAEALRKALPEARIVIAADNDPTGREAAEAAAVAVSGEVRCPKCDWNDVHKLAGIEAVRAAL